MNELLDESVSKEDISLIKETLSSCQDDSSNTNMDEISINNNEINCNIKRDEKELGSKSCPFKLLIVGGGPSGCSIIVRAARLGLLDELCGYSLLNMDGSVNSSIDQSSKDSKENLTKVGGVCIVDSGSIDKFGGGKLQVCQYLINLFNL